MSKPPVLKQPEPRRLLVVEDDKKIAQAVDVRLKSAGYDVEVVHNGKAGIEAAVQTAPDAIILDLRMPGIGGFALLAKLRKQKQIQHIPIVVLSASAVEERKALDAGAYCFLAKPYHPQALLASVDSALRHNSRTPTGSGVCAPLLLSPGELGSEPGAKRQGK